MLILLFFTDFWSTCMFQLVWFSVAHLWQGTEVTKKRKRELAEERRAKNKVPRVDLKKNKVLQLSLCKKKDLVVHAFEVFNNSFFLFLLLLLLLLSFMPQQKEKQKQTEKKRGPGVKRLKLLPESKPKTVAYCRHYLKGKCQKVAQQYPTLYHLGFMFGWEVSIA